MGASKQPIKTKCSMNILDRIPSESKLASELSRLVFGRRPRCPRCGTARVRRSERRYRCPRCRRPFSPKGASWLKGTKLSLRGLWLLVYCWQRRIPFSATLDVTGLSHVTVRRWRRRFQAALDCGSPTLEGLVEVDETFVGRRRTGNQRIVVGAWSRTQRKAVLRCVPDREQGTTDRFLLAHVEARGTTVLTDGWAGYRGIDSFFGYGHVTCNHSKWAFGPTNMAENLWSRLDRLIARVYQQARARWLPLLVRELEARINEPSVFESPEAFFKNSTALVPTR